jgi:hypothetical protein
VEGMEEARPRKVHKVTLMIVDHDGIGTDGVKTVIENTRYPNHCISPSVMAIETQTVEWSDDHPLNNTTKQRAEFDRLFGGGAP